MLERDITSFLQQSRIDWHRPSPLTTPEIVIQNVDCVESRNVNEVLHTVNKAANILGLFEKDMRGETIWKQRISVMDQTELQRIVGKNAQAVTVYDDVFFGSDLFNDDLLANKNTEEFSKVLGQAVEPGSIEELLLVGFAREAVIAHEMYHVRQREILVEIKCKNRNLFKLHEPTDGEEEGAYGYEEEFEMPHDLTERGACAFEVRYLLEERKRMPSDSLEANILGKYIKYLSSLYTANG